MGTYYSFGMIILGLKRKHISKKLKNILDELCFFNVKQDGLLLRGICCDCKGYIKRNGSLESEFLEKIKPYITHGGVLGSGEGEMWTHIFDICKEEWMYKRHQ